MDELHVDLDIDIWGRGRDAAKAGRLTNPMLRAAGYPYVDLFETPKYFKDSTLVKKILEDHYEPDIYGQKPYLIRKDHLVFYVFFQSKEERDMFKVLMLLY